MQCNHNSFIQIINFHGLFRNALRCRKTGACRMLVPLRYYPCKRCNRSPLYKLLCKCFVKMSLGPGNSVEVMTWHMQISVLVHAHLRLAFSIAKNTGLCHGAIVCEPNSRMRCDFSCARHVLKESGIRLLQRMYAIGGRSSLPLRCHGCRFMRNHCACAPML